FKGPAEGERPTAYIIICADKNIAPNVERFNMDVGIAAQTIMLAAAEKGLGGCMIGNYSKEALSDALKLPENICPALILALGKPNEQIILEDAKNEKDIGYYRDENNIHHVPKRTLDELIIHAEI
ncbi:MAG TPA: nitroreductase, partial [Ruminococcaceae bacterium]|nr:nitroreductase [Oscillospiraceae bacterium]